MVNESFYLSDDEKLLIGWLAHGNSVLDIMRSYVFELKEQGKFESLVQEIKSDIVDNLDPQTDSTGPTEEKFYRETVFNQLVQSELNPIVG